MKPATIAPTQVIPCPGMNAFLQRNDNTWHKVVKSDCKGVEIVEVYKPPDAG